MGGAGFTEPTRARGLRPGIAGQPQLEKAMTQYLFIESKDPLEDRGAVSYLETALELRRLDQPVIVYFVENGSHAARGGAEVSSRDALHAAGASLKVDAFALRERGISSDRLAPGVEPGDVDDIVELLANPETKAVWH